MGDMLLRSTYADLESEREVVLEEIAMYEDEPQDKVHDVLSTAIFGDHPLGRPVIGRGEVISSLTVGHGLGLPRRPLPAGRDRRRGRRATSSTSRSSSSRERWLDVSRNGDVRKPEGGAAAA